ncbi:MAG: erythromycin esterase family protein [bacterium]|nr:erythromycin esterase family protein [bacterium]
MINVTRVPCNSMRASRTVGIGVAMIAALPHTWAAADDVSEEEFVAWVQESAVPFEKWKMNAALAAWLDEAIGERRIVFLGEPGHFFQEKYDVQLMLIEHLAQRGYRHLFIEGLGASMAEIVDEHVRTSPDEDSREAGSERYERYRTRVLGHDAESETREFSRRLSAAQRAFVDALQAINSRVADAAGPLTIHPLDVDMKPGGCVLSITALLESYPDEVELQVLGAACDREGEEPFGTWIGRLESIQDRLKAHEGGLLDALTAPDRARLLQCVDCLVESLAFVDTRAADGKMDRALVRREPAMYRQVEAALSRLPADARVIMMAHNNHLSRVGADTMRARQPSVGEMIETAHPGEVFSMWMLHDHGQLLNPMAPELLEELASSPERVESLLVRAGEAFVLPLHSGSVGERYLDEKRRLSYFSWYETATLTRQTDALIFIDAITPLSPP